MKSPNPRILLGMVKTVLVIYIEDLIFSTFPASKKQHKSGQQDELNCRALHFQQNHPLL